MNWVYYFGRGLIRILVFPFATWKVKGKEKLKTGGPWLVVCNHLHLADPPIVAASLPTKCVFMAKEDLFQDGWSRFWVKNFGAFPVRRGGIDREAIRQAEDWLKKEVSVIMFPEGGRSQTGQLQEALNGAAFIALRLGVPVLPVGIAGTEKIKNLSRCFREHPRITINIGEPINPAPTKGKITRDQRLKLMNDIMKKIAALIPPEYRGVYETEDKTGH
jgi:1-acyl-sn-glycerol-3-phosphate acyltransferase